MKAQSVFFLKVNKFINLQYCLVHNIVHNISIHIISTLMSNTEAIEAEHLPFCIITETVTSKHRRCEMHKKEHSFLL